MASAAVPILSFPREVVVLIFQRLSRKELAKAARVCQTWHRYSKDPSLRWEPFVKVLLVERSLASNANTRQSRIDSRKKDEAEGRKPYWLVSANWQLRIITENNEPWADVQVLSHSPFFGVGAPPAIDKATRDSLIKWEFEPLARDQQRQYMTMFWGGCTDRDLVYPCAWSARMMINIHKIEQAVKEDLPRPWESWLVQQFVSSLGTEYHLDKMSFDYRAVHTPLERQGEELEQPKGFQEGLKLHPYQLEAVRWMNLVEEETDKGFDYTSLAVWKSARTDLLVDLREQKLATAAAAASRLHQVKFRGGILADEMGLGKTMEVLGLVLSHPASAKCLEYHPGSLIPTGATLVMCPNHLAKQWMEEIRTRAPALKAHLIGTIVDRRSLTLQSVLDADVIVVSYNFLTNKNYNREGNYASDQVARLNRLKMEISKLSQVSNVKQVYIEQFLWHRIILDEAHDAMKDHTLATILKYIEGRYKWWVSGTPFPSGALLQHAREWLAPDAVHPYANREPTGKAMNGNEKFYQMWIECDLMLNNLYWRNTKNSVNSDWSIPNLKHKTIMLDFQPVEKLHYDDMAFHYSSDATHNMLLQVCSSAGSSYGISSLNELILHMQSLLTSRLRLTEQQVKTNRIAMENPVYAGHNDYYEAEIERCEAMIAHTKKLIPRAEALTPWVAAAPGEKRAKLEQPKHKTKNKRAKKNADAEPEAEDQPAESGSKKSGRRAASPARRVTRAKASAVVFEDSDAEAVAASPNESLESLVQQLGTKLGNVIAWLRELLKNDDKARVILFSAFSAYLTRVETVLTQQRIPTVHVEGNIFRKSKALREFKQDDEVRVILLCSERAAAGTNLMEASHVVLLDPMTGTKEEALAAESQAIGRAYRQGQKGQVTVVRFVIRGTVDHELYLRNTESDEKDASIKRVASGRAQLVRTSSLSVALADRSKSATLSRKGSVSNLLENNPKLH